MNVLSLFDGMSCGQLALNRAGINYDNYYASEIDKYAIRVTQSNFPKTIQLGNVTDISGSDLPDIGLLIGGSPCQSFSRIGDGTGFDGSSRLFWEFVRLLKEVNPKYFLLENVVMKKEWEDIITNALGVSPIKISSELFVPQSRVRLYWTNIPNIPKPVQIDYDVNKFFTAPGFPSSCNIKRYFKKKEVFNTLTATYYKGIRASSRPAVSTCEGFLDDNREAHRMLTPSECELLQSVPIGYTDCGVSNTQRYKMLGNGWTVDVIAHILKHAR